MDSEQPMLTWLERQRLFARLALARAAWRPATLAWAPHIGLARARLIQPFRMTLLPYAAGAALRHRQLPSMAELFWWRRHTPGATLLASRRRLRRTAAATARATRMLSDVEEPASELAETPLVGNTAMTVAEAPSLNEFEEPRTPRTSVDAPGVVARVWRRLFGEQSTTSSNTPFGVVFGARRRRPTLQQNDDSVSFAVAAPAAARPSEPLPAHGQPAALRTTDVPVARHALAAVDLGLPPMDAGSTQSTGEPELARVLAALASTAAIDLIAPLSVEVVRRSFTRVALPKAHAAETDAVSASSEPAAWLPPPLQSEPGSELVIERDSKQLPWAGVDESASPSRANSELAPLPAPEVLARIVAEFTARQAAEPAPAVETKQPAHIDAKPGPDPNIEVIGPARRWRVVPGRPLLQAKVPPAETVLASPSDAGGQEPTGIADTAPPGAQSSRMEPAAAEDDTAPNTAWMDEVQQPLVGPVAPDEPRRTGSGPAPSGIQEESPSRDQHAEQPGSGAAASPALRPPLSEPEALAEPANEARSPLVERPWEAADEELAHVVIHLPAPMAEAAIAQGVFGYRSAPPLASTPPPPAPGPPAGPGSGAGGSSAQPPDTWRARFEAVRLTAPRARAAAIPPIVRPSKSTAGEPERVTDPGAPPAGAPHAADAQRGSTLSRAGLVLAPVAGRASNAAPAGEAAAAAANWQAAPVSAPSRSVGATALPAASAGGPGSLQRAPLERPSAAPDAADAAASAGAEPPAGPPAGQAASEGPTPTSGADLDRLTEEVFGRLRWRLSAERERTME